MNKIGTVSDCVLSPPTCMSWYVLGGDTSTSDVVAGSRAILTFFLKPQSPQPLATVSL